MRESYLGLIITLILILIFKNQIYNFLGLPIWAIFIIIVIIILIIIYFKRKFLYFFKKIENFQKDIIIAILIILITNLLIICDSISIINSLFFYGERIIYYTIDLNYSGIIITIAIYLTAVVLQLPEENE